MQIQRRAARRIRPPRRGGAAVEFALILPSMIGLVLGCIDFGRFAYDYEAVKHAASAGALYAAMNPPNTVTMNTWVADVRLAVADEMRGRAGFNSANVGVTRISDGGGAYRDRVFVPHQFRTVFYWQWLGLPATINMQSVSETREMRRILP
jgi:Flp pilus assembly protein TadG